MKIKENRALSFIIVAIVYIIATVAGIFIYRALPFSFWLNLLIADVASTVITFIFSCIFKNASVYDPYWSVQPPVILIAFAIGKSMNATRILLLISVCFWGLRLTAHWACTFKNLTHQDWRYTMLYVKTGTLTGKLKIPMLFPVLWAFAETLGFFSVTVSYIKISQLFLAIYSAAFLMLFLFENARVTTGIGRKAALWFYYATGIIAAGFCVATGVPALLAAVFKPELVVEYCPFELYTLGGGLYAFASLFVRAEETAEINDTVTENE